LLLLIKVNGQEALNIEASSLRNYGWYAPHWDCQHNDHEGPRLNEIAS